MFLNDKLNMYATNRPSMLRLAGVGAHMGLRALLRDAASGAALAATVTPQQPAGAWAPEVSAGVEGGGAGESCPWKRGRGARRLGARRWVTWGSRERPSH